MKFSYVKKVWGKGIKKHVKLSVHSFQFIMQPLHRNYNMGVIRVIRRCNGEDTEGIRKENGEEFESAVP